MPAAAPPGRLRRAPIGMYAAEYEEGPGDPMDEEPGGPSAGDVVYEKPYSSGDESDDPDPLDYGEELYQMRLKWHRDYKARGAPPKALADRVAQYLPVKEIFNVALRNSKGDLTDTCAVMRKFCLMLGKNEFVCNQKDWEFGLWLLGVAPPFTTTTTKFAANLAKRVQGRSLLIPAATELLRSYTYTEQNGLLDPETPPKLVFRIVCKQIDATWDPVTTPDVGTIRSDPNPGWLSTLRVGAMYNSLSIMRWVEESRVAKGAYLNNTADAMALGNMVRTRMNADNDLFTNYGVTVAPYVANVYVYMLELLNKHLIEVVQSRTTRPRATDPTVPGDERAGALPELGYHWELVAMRYLIDDYSMAMCAMAQIAMRSNDVRLYERVVEEVIMYDRRFREWTPTEETADPTQTELFRRTVKYERKLGDSFARYWYNTLRRRDPDTGVAFGDNPDWIYPLMQGLREDSAFLSPASEAADQLSKLRGWQDALSRYGEWPVKDDE